MSASPVISRVELLVDAILSDPPTDNGNLLEHAVSFDEQAEQLMAAATAYRDQATRLRDFVAARQARADGTRDPLSI